MCNQSLISFVLISFSIVSAAAAIPLDADQAVPDTFQNAVLHKEVVWVQGGGSDKDVVDTFAVTTMDKCQGDLACNKNPLQSGVIGDTRIYMHQSINDWFVPGSSGSLPTLMVWWILLAAVVFFLSRKSASTK